MALARTIDDQSTANETAWGIDSDRLAALHTLTAAAIAAYAANSDEATRNRITSAEKKAAFAELKHFLGTYINYLEVNSRVPDAALAYMGLRPRKRRASLSLSGHSGFMIRWRMEGDAPDSRLHTPASHLLLQPGRRNKAHLPVGRVGKLAPATRTVER